MKKCKNNGKIMDGFIGNWHPCECDICITNDADKYSNCCGSFMDSWHEDCLICPECKEHCGLTTECITCRGNGCQGCHGVGYLVRIMNKINSTQIIAIFLFLTMCLVAYSLRLTDEKLIERNIKCQVK